MAQCCAQILIVQVLLGFSKSKLIFSYRRHISDSWRWAYREPQCLLHLSLSNNFPFQQVRGKGFLVDSSNVGRKVGELNGLKTNQWTELVIASQFQKQENRLKIFLPCYEKWKKKGSREIQCYIFQTNLLGSRYISIIVSFTGRARPFSFIVEAKNKYTFVNSGVLESHQGTPTSH